MIPTFEEFLNEGKKYTVSKDEMDKLVERIKDALDALKSQVNVEFEILDDTRIIASVPNKKYEVQMLKERLHSIRDTIDSNGKIFVSTNMFNKGDMKQGLVDSSLYVGNKSWVNFLGLKKRK